MDTLLDLVNGNPLAAISLGVVVALVLSVRYLGLWQGERSAKTGNSGETGRILGAVIDGRKADDLIEAFNKVGGRIDRLCDLLEDRAMEEEIDRRVEERMRAGRKNER